MDLKEQIIEAATEEFNEKGLKFTMDDIAKRLGISKKTIYTVFKDKESLFLETVDYCFGAIKECERTILEDESLDIVEKIRRIIIVLPNRYASLDFRQLYDLKIKFPKTYSKIEVRLENDWEPTLRLIEQGIAEKRIKPISIPILRTMISATIEHFISRNVLIENEIDYVAALNEMIDIIMLGIIM